LEQTDITTLMMEAVTTSETSVYSETTRRYIPARSPLHTRRRENLKSHENIICIHTRLLNFFFFFFGMQFL
jgi:hypothetical protein